MPDPTRCPRCGSHAPGLAFACPPRRELDGNRWGFTLAAEGEEWACHRCTKRLWRLLELSRGGCIVWRSGAVLSG
jgi:hypothetical protein